MLNLFTGPNLLSVDGYPLNLDYYFFDFLLHNL
jgi:hypothetical protein